jgi:Ca2+-binding RTX toxin-like protein
VGFKDREGAMADPDIRNLDWGFTYRSPGEASRIDKHSDAIVTDPDNDLATLEVALDTESGFIGIHTEPGKVTLDNGIISIVGVAIGEVQGLGTSYLTVTFNDDATPDRVQELIRALTFTSTAGGFTGLETITILLQDKGGGGASAIVAIADKVSGTGDDETFSTTYDVIDDGDELDGGGGNDVFELTGGGVFDLVRMRSITNVETIRGSAANDFIAISGSQLSGVQRIESGGTVIGDTLTMAGLSIDLSGIAIEGFATIALADHRAGIIVDNVATAKLVTGYETRNDTLTLKTGTLTALERQILHQQGIDTIVTKGANGQNVITTHRAPQITSFSGATINAPIGTTAFLDAGQDAVLVADSIILQSLSVHVSGAADMTERIDIDPTSGVTLSQGHTYLEVKVDGRVIGRVDGVGTSSVSFNFDDQATYARVQTLIRALTYTKSDGTANKLRTVQFSLKDVGGRETTAEVSIDLSANAAPSDIGLSPQSIQELSPANAWVGDLSATDAAGTTFTYTLVNDAGGRFKIEGSQLKVAQGALLDHEQNKSHAIRVKATDQDGLSYEKSFTIKIDDVDRERITGTVGSDAFVGGSGNDKIDGGYGNDRLTGGKGKDIFVFKSALNKTKNVDVIADFKPKDDTIQLENKIFKKLKKTGMLNKDFFTVGAKAKDKNDYIVYDKAKGLLFYDADGSGKGKATLFAKLQAGIDHKDFFVI